MKYIFRLMTVIAIVAVSAAFTSNDKDVTPCKHDIVLLEDINLSIEEAKGLSREETIKFPIAEQKAIYRTWTAEKQKLVWQIKLLKTAKLYKGEQKRLIKDAVNFIEPSMDTIKKLFPDANEAETIFSSLYIIGETQTPFVHMIEASADNNMQPYDCTCNWTVPDQDYCWYGLVCQGAPCVEQFWSCGFMWWYSCDGYCGAPGSGGGDPNDDDCEPDCE